MAKNTETTTKFKVDISQLKAAFQEANRAIDLTNSRFKEATAGMENWRKSADGITAKISQLQNLNKNYQKILNGVAEQYKKVVESEGENSAAAQKLEIKMNSLKAAIKGNEAAINKYQNELDDIDKTCNDAEKSLEKVSKEIKETGEQAEKSEGKLKGFLGSIGKGVLGGIGAAVTGLAGGLTAASESSKEFNDNMSKLSASANDAGYSTKFAEDSFKNMYGILGDETAANTTVSNFMAMETSQENLNSLLNSSAGIWAKYGDSIPLDGLAESVNETAKVGQITGNLADALNWAGISEDEFNEKLSSLSTEQERQQLIVDTLNKEYGELGKQYKKNNSAVIDLNTAQVEMKDSIAAIGTAFTPILAMFTQFGAGVLSSIVPDVESLGAAFSDLVNGVDGAEDKIGGAIGNIINTIVNTIVGILPQIASIGISIIQSLLSGLMDGSGINKIFSVAEQIVITLINGIVQLAPQLLSAAIILIQRLIMSLIDLAPDLLMGAIQLFQGLIDALMSLDLPGLLNEIITNLIYTLMDAVPQLLEAAVTLFNAIVQAIPVVVQQLVSMLPYIIKDITAFLIEAVPQLLEAAITMFNALIEAIPVLINALITELPNILNTITEFLSTSIPMLINAAIDFLMAIVDALPTIIQALIDALPTIISTLIDFLLTNIPVLLDGAIKLFMALIKAIPTICKELLKAVPDIILAIFNGLKDLPSKLWEYFVNIWGSIKDIFSGVGDYFGSVFSNAVDLIKSAFSSIPKFFSGLWDGIKDIFSGVADWFGNVFDGVVSAIKTPINWVIDALNFLIGGMNKLSFDIPDWVPPPLGGKHFGFDIPEIPQLAKGGVVDKPTTALIGEDGKEAVIPLENNLQWIDKIAEKLSKELKSVITNNSSVTYNFYQTNNSPKPLNRLEIYRQSKNLLGGVSRV